MMRTTLPNPLTERVPKLEESEHWAQMILGLVAFGRRLRHLSISAHAETSVIEPDQTAALQLALGIVAVARRFEPPADLPPPALAAASGPSFRGSLLL